MRKLEMNRGKNMGTTKNKHTSLRHEELVVSGLWIGL